MRLKSIGMKRPTKFLGKYLLNISIIAFSFYAFGGNLYWLLLPKIGVGFSYVAEQMLPAIVALIIGFVIFTIDKKKLSLNSLKNILFDHKNYFIPLLAAVILAHGWILGYYFFAEDVSSILSPVNNHNLQFPFRSLINGYPFSPFVLSFLLFKTNAFAYNLLSFFLFLGSASLFYWFLYTLLNNKFFSLLASLFFATTPSFLDMFSWQASVQGMSSVLVLSLLSLIFLIYFQRRPSDYHHLLLSLLFFTSSLNMGFVRAGGIAIVILFLILLLGPKLKLSLKDRVVSLLSYLIIWLFFIWIRFGLGLLLAPVSLLSKAGNNLATETTYFSFIAYYLSHLILPTEIARFILPKIKENFSSLESVSFIFILGLLTLFSLFVLTLVAFWKRKKIVWWVVLLGIIFILANIFYLPFFSAGATSKVALFDQYFVRNIPPYGPGARYVFFPALGISILFTIFTVGLIKRKRIFRRIGIFLIIVAISLNIYLSFKGHLKVIQSISIPERSLIDNFFKLVPADLKPKLVFSANPQKNAIEHNVSGKNWLYGFYKTSELTYANSENELYALINSGKYKKENVYAFYNNPETHIFADLSSDIRQQIYESKGSANGQTINFSVKGASITRTNIDGKDLGILKRAILESEDLNKRLLFKKTLTIDLSVDRLLPKILPYSDFILNNGYPNILWSLVTENSPAIFDQKYGPPPEFTLSSFNYSDLSDFPLSDKLGIISILNARDKLRKNMSVVVSNKEIEEKRSDENALIDGQYNADPLPSDEEKFYLARKNPVTIKINLPYPIILGRLLLNTPKAYAAEYAPSDFEVTSSNDGIIFEEVGDTQTQEENNWSPNNGKMVKINLKPISSQYLRLAIKKTSSKPVMLDEITVDDWNGLKYSPEQIVDYQRNAFLYLENQTLLDHLVSLDYYNKIPLIYACAEQTDWQRQQRDFKTFLPGVWKVKNLDLHTPRLTLPINCNGSVLRKIIIFGPPYPVKMLVDGAILE